MKPGGLEAVIGAIRRSAWLIIGLMLLNAAAMNVIMQLKGSRYEATARVVLSPTDLAAAVTGIQAPYVDPQRSDEAERTLASSSGLYERAAQRTGGRFGSGSALHSATEVSGGNRILYFSATTKDPEVSVGIANAVASAYPDWRADVFGSEIRTALRQLREKIVESPKNPQLQEQLNRLELLNTLNSGQAILVENSGGATKTTPAPVRDSALGLVIGLFLGLLLAGAREALDTRVRSEGEIEETLGVPVLASVHTFPRRTRLVMFGRHEEIFGDTYDLIAANLIQMGAAGPTLLAVTSAVASEGKTSTASNLSIALARRGMDVILVDVDVRKPSVAETFRLPAGSPGLVEVLSGKNDIAEMLYNVSVNGAQPMSERRAKKATGNGRRLSPAAEGTLHILAAGASAPDRGMIRSQRLRGLLDELKRRADIVILDTAPALATAEMAELSRHVDLVLVVVRQGGVTVRALRSLHRQIGNWGTNVVGAVVTDVAPTHDYGYHIAR